MKLTTSRATRVEEIDGAMWKFERSAVSVRPDLAIAGVHFERPTIPQTQRVDRAHPRRWYWADMGMVGLLLHYRGTDETRLSLPFHTHESELQAGEAYGVSVSNRSVESLFQAGYFAYNTEAILLTMSAL